MEHPPHTGVKVPGVVEVVAEDVFRIDEEVGRVGDRRLNPEADVKPISLVVDRSVRGHVTRGDVGHFDPLMAVPFLQPVGLRVEDSALFFAEAAPDPKPEASDRGIDLFLIDARSLIRAVGGFRNHHVLDLRLRFQEPKRVFLGELAAEL